VTYVAAYGKLDAAVLAIGLVLLVLSAQLAGAYLSVYPQRNVICAWLRGSDYKARE